MVRLPNVENTKINNFVLTFFVCRVVKYVSGILQGCQRVYVNESKNGFSPFLKNRINDKINCRFIIIDAKNNTNLTRALLFVAGGKVAKSGRQTTDKAYAYPRVFKRIIK